MSSRRTKPQPLSDSEIRQIAADIAAGRPPMVWFTSAAVGVPEGRSGKVLALGDPAEGDFLQVKPTGSKDVLSFGPTEVTLVKPARPQKEAAAAKKTANKPAAPKPTTATRKDSTVTMSSPATMSSAVPSTPSAAPVAPKPEAPQASGGAAPQASGSPTPQASGSAAPQAPTAGAAPAADSGKPAKPAGSRPARNAAAASAARKPKAPEVTVTLSGTADGEWTLDVVNGKKRTIRGLSVPSSAVAQAAKILHPEVAEVVDSVLDAVRTAQRSKVEQLQAELENARKLLDELTS
ncbi:DUF6319 family protein [Nocardia sp. NPDC050406]|uniref:DUF6319 family protein n=1 Tax=Nocardia sp. NPDC050406 TaxID=3364318 RepID=UPI0037A48533